MSTVLVNPYRYTAGAGLEPPAGAELWLRADEAGLADGNVSTWHDQSGNGRDGTGQGSTLPQKVSGVVNGLPVIRFNGTTAYFTLPNYMTGFTASTLGMALKIDADPPGSGTQTGIFWMSSSGENTHYPWTDASIYVSYGRGNRYSANPSVALTSWHRLIITFNASDWKLYINGSVVIDQGASSAGWSTAPKIGKSNGSFFLDGDMTDVVQYSTYADAVAIAALDAYLAARIGA